MIGKDGQKPVVSELCSIVPYPKSSVNGNQEEDSILAWSVQWTLFMFRFEDEVCRVKQQKCKQLRRFKSYDLDF